MLFRSLGGFQDRCGPGQRIPFLVISPFAKRNYVGSSLITQSSVVRFIEDNWGLGQIGGGSFADTAGPITDLFDFKHPHDAAVLLRADGTVKGTKGRTGRK